MSEKLEQLTVAVAETPSTLGMPNANVAKQKPPKNGSPMTEDRLVILRDGFVFHGEMEIKDGWVYIYNPKNVRQWGTNHGLGHLALSGPNAETAYDAWGLVETPIRNLIFSMRCHTKWPDPK